MGLYQIQVLSFFWACALIISSVSSSEWIGQLSSTWGLLLACGLAIVLLTRIESRRILQLSVIAYLVAVWSMMPHVPNHRIVLAFAGVAILLGTSPGATPGAAVNNLRWLTLVVYFFAILAKVNHDYLRADVSCASEFLVETLQLHAMRPDSIAARGAMTSSVGYWSIITELLIAVALISERTRVVGILLGVVFHLALSAHYLKWFANFSAVIFVLLSSWLCEEQSYRLVTRFIHRYRWVFFCWAVLLYVLWASHAAGILKPIAWVLIRYEFWGAFALYALITIARSASGVRVHSGRIGLFTPNLLLIGVACASGLSPYVGIKTRSSFSMYSNLRVEPEYSNHLFMPPSIDALGYLSDSVRIISSVDPLLSTLVDSPHERLPYIALCEYLARSADTSGGAAVSISYERRGLQLTAIQGGELPSDCPSWIARKLLLFGTVGDGAERRCVW